MDANTATGWRVIAASAPGAIHLEKALPCQDAYAYCLLPGGELLAAVSDGAGSAERSREGAQMAVDAALAGLDALCRGEAPGNEAGWQTVITGLFDEIHQKLAALAGAEGNPLREFAATLTCALVTAEWLVVGQIGDGAAITEGVDSALFLAVPPQRGEYANEAYFLTQPEAMLFTVVYATRQPVRALALTTDGLLRLAFKLPEYKPYPGFFQPLFTFVRESTDVTQAQAELAGFLVSERVSARSDDDKTLLLAVRTEQTGGRLGRRNQRRRKDVCT